MLKELGSSYQKEASASEYPTAIARTSQKMF